MTNPLCLCGCGIPVKEPHRKFYSYRCKGRYQVKPNRPENHYEDFSDKFKRRIRTREGNRCIVCSAPAGKRYGPPHLVVHHISHKKTETTEENCCLVCSKCHGVIHNSEESQEWIFWLKSIMALRGIIDFPEASIPIDIIAAHIKKIKAKYAKAGIVFQRQERGNL